MEYHHNLLVQNPFRVARLFITPDSELVVPGDKMMKENVKVSLSALQKLREILEECHFGSSPEFIDSVSDALLVLESTQCDELVKCAFNNQG